MCIFKRRVFERNDCPICLEHIDNDEKNLLSCGHWVHYVCILRDYHYTDRLKCPICRKKLNFNWNYKINFEDTISFIISILVYSTIKLPEVFYSMSELVRIFSR